MDRRLHVRHKRLFPVRFGDGESEYEGQTRDVSDGGLFVATREGLAVGARLWVEVAVEPERALFFEGVVVRQLDALPQRRRESGFAVRFVSPAEALGPYLPHPPGGGLTRLTLSYATREHLERASARGLWRGQAFVWALEEREVGERVALRLDAGFAARSLEVAATVTQVVPDAARFGLALALDDAPRVTALIADCLGDAR
jgi:hypothetical protein